MPRHESRTTQLPCQPPIVPPVRAAAPLLLTVSTRPVGAGWRREIPSMSKRIAVVLACVLGLNAIFKQRDKLEY